MTTKEYNKKWRESHPNYWKEWGIKNKDKVRKQRKEYRAKNKEKQQLYSRKYIKENYQKKLKYNNLYRKNRRKKDPFYKIQNNLRARIWKVLKRKKNVKSRGTTELLGCSIIEFKKYLESKFQAGMTWGNYGKWHIDHIKPCASFDLSKSKQQKLCFHYTNLQPLWALDNIRKSAKIWL